MALEGLLWCIAALLGTGVAALALARRPHAATALVYGVSLGVTLVALVAARRLAPRARVLRRQR